MGAEQPGGRICERCQVAPAENWPGSKGGELCQDCWEAECSESWWEMMRLFEEVDAPVSAAPAGHPLSRAMAGDEGEG